MLNAEVNKFEVVRVFFEGFSEICRGTHIRKVSGTIVTTRRYLGDGKYAEHRVYGDN